MNNTIHKRTSGFLWSETTQLMVDGMMIPAILTGDSMRKINAHELISGRKKGEFISHGTLRFVKDKDSGYDARTLVYIPNRTKFPTHERAIVDSMIIASIK